jgi:phosphoribosylformimino-5-aminoimidazole carboxamide ribotide isomerase
MELLESGVKKVVVSTMLLGDQKFASRIKRKYYGRLIGSFDFKEGKLSYAGWTKQSSIPFEEAAEGLAEIVVTDTSRDGTLNGPNLELLDSLRGRCKAKIIAAGGIRDAIDLIELESVGVDAAIVGRAFLENWADSWDIIKFEMRGRE